MCPFTTGGDWVNCCLAASSENAVRHAWHSRDEVAAVRVLEEQLQLLVHRPGRPHAGGRPHHLQLGRRRQERAWRPYSCREHATDSFVLSSQMCLSSSENGRVEAEDDEGDDWDDEADAGDATASADMIFVKSFTPADFLKNLSWSWTLILKKSEMWNFVPVKIP